MQDNGSPDRTPPNFVVIARAWAWEQDVTPATRKLVLLAVCERLNHGTGVAWPGADDIARRCILNRRQTQVHLAALIDAGLLVVVERKHGKGRPYPVYTVPPLVQWAAQSPQVSGALSAVERTNLVQPAAQTFVQSTAPEPVTPEPETRTSGGPPTAVGERRDSGNGERPPRQPTNKNSHVIDGLKARGYRPTLSARDHQAIKSTDLTAEQIVAVYHAILATPFGDDFMRRGSASNGVAKAIASWDSYQAHLKKHATPNGPSAATLARLRRHEEAEAQERNLRRERPTTPSPL